jgi:hypothetical protein
MGSGALEGTRAAELAFRGFAQAGRTPVLEASARWAKLSMISAITNRGEIAFQIIEGTINAERFIELLERLTASYAISKRFSVFGAVKNLTGERYIASLRQGRGRDSRRKDLPPLLTARRRTWAGCRRPRGPITCKNCPM